MPDERQSREEFLRRLARARLAWSPAGLGWHCFRHAEAAAAGATIGRLGAETFWGGYTGVFLDPDGHPWEVAHNPGWPLGPDGEVQLPAPG